jgi:hypothetical protein
MGVHKPLPEPVSLAECIVGYFQRYPSDAFFAYIN